MQPIATRGSTVKIGDVNDELLPRMAYVQRDLRNHIIVLKTPWRRACDFLCRKQRREQPVSLVNLVAMLLVLCQLSCKVIGYVDSQA